MLYIFLFSGELQYATSLDSSPEADTVLILRSSLVTSSSMQLDFLDPTRLYTPAN